MDVLSLTSAGLIAALAVLVLVHLWSGSRTGETEPPGPRPLPLLGNLLQLDLKGPQNTFMEFHRKYGSVFQIFLGPKKVVVLAGFQTLKEALEERGEEFGERDVQPIMEEVSKGHGVLWSNGPSWYEMRSFCKTHLLDFGAGPKASEEKIQEESLHLAAALTECGGDPVDTSGPLTLAACNAICSVVFGRRFRYDDPEFSAMVDRHMRAPLLAGSPSMQIYTMFPSLGRWISNRQEYLDLYSKSLDQCSNIIAGLRDTLDPRVSRSFVDAFLTRQKELKDSGDTEGQYHDQNLMTTALNLVGAGTDALGTTLRWALLLMAKFPQVQDQVKLELRCVVGARQVRLEDRQNLPFSNAVVHETQRFANIAPIGLPHRTSQDLHFRGKWIQKGTTVIPLLSSALFDDDEWETPHCFNPAHFLDQEGKFVQRDSFLPFSAGVRGCVGQDLAKSILFLFFTHLMTRFRFTPPPGVSEETLDLSPRQRPFLSPQPHTLCPLLET